MATADAFLQPFLPKRKQPWRVASVILALVTVGSISWYLLNPPQTPDNIFDNPPPAELFETLPPAQQEEITDLLEVAQLQIEMGRLIAPQGGSALDFYQKVLALHPFDRQAIDGLSQLYDQLTELASTALATGDRQRAVKIVKVGLNFHPKHPALNAILEQLSQAPPI